MPALARGSGAAASRGFARKVLAALGTMIADVASGALRLVASLGAVAGTVVVGFDVEKLLGGALGADGSGRAAGTLRVSRSENDAASAMAAMTAPASPRRSQGSRFL